MGKMFRELGFVNLKDEIWASGNSFSKFYGHNNFDTNQYKFLIFSYICKIFSYPTPLIILFLIYIPYGILMHKEIRFFLAGGKGYFEKYVIIF
jgi:hypothetical protein